MAKGSMGIIGAALGGAVDVLAPVAQANAIEKMRAEIQAKRDAALFAQQRAMAQEEMAFRGAEGQADRDLRESLAQAQLGQGDRRLGLIESQMGQEGAQFERAQGFREQAHGDELALEQEKLDLLRQGAGGSQSQSSDMQMINFLQSQLGKSPEEAFEMWSATKNDPRKFIQQYVLAAVRSQDALGALTGDQKSPDQLAQEGLSVYEAIMGGAPAQNNTGDNDPLGIRQYLNPDNPKR